VSSSLLRLSDVVLNYAQRELIFNPLSLLKVEKMALEITMLSTDIKILPNELLVSFGFKK
jgi:hypothetical protein